MKSFQNFGINIVEAERRAYGNPTGYGPGGEPMYTRRPGPKEPGRRAQVQSSPQSVSSVKADIEARRGFSGARSGGLENRPVPYIVTVKRQERATAAGTPDPWTSKSGKKFNFTPQDLENATTTLRNPMRSRGGSQAFADFVGDFSNQTGTPRGEVLRQNVSGISVPDAETSFRRMFGAALRSQRKAQLQNPTQARQLGLFPGSDQPVPSRKPEPALVPTKPIPIVPKGQLDIPEPVSQAQVSQQAAKYRKAQTAQRATTAMGGTPSSVSFSSSTPSKTPGSKASQVIDAELVEPKKQPELKLGSQPGGQIEPSGAQRTPSKGVTAGLGPVRNPNAVEPVTVNVIEPPEAPKAPKAPTVSSAPVKATSTPKLKVVTPSSVSLSLTRTPAPAVTRGAALSVTKPKAPDLGKIVTDVLKTEREAKKAEKAATVAKTSRALSRIGTLGAVVSSGIEGKTEFDKARSGGASFNRALGAGAVKSLGGLTGAAFGAAAGGAVAGLPGAFLGGTVGYTQGGNLASSAYRQITGDPLKKLTTKDVLTNVRKAVPQEIRAQVPAGARKAFRDFVTQAGRTYGNYRRSQEAQK